MTKEALLAELSYNTFVMLKPSPVEGIGVFAGCNIPAGCRNMFSQPTNPPEEYLEILKTEIDLLPAHAKHLVANYCLYDDKNYFVPAQGFKKMDLVSFINHSDMPNIISINEGEYFEALRDIESGEELLVDYGELVDG